jgi:tRNA pseudouridine55 synthase
LLVDKPSGPTSHDVIARVRRALGTRAVGHTGTLDPFASGLLVVLVGRATRLARFVEQQRKTYRATARLGAATTTDDLTGEPIPASAGARTTAAPPTRGEVEAALHALRGPGRQRPPAFSAKHVAGQRSYVRARRGESVALPEADVVIESLELLAYDYPEVQFRARVSAGTYLRAIARDLGERLGTGAHLVALRREAIGALRVEDAVAPEAVGPEAVRPPQDVLGHLPRIAVGEGEAAALGFGRAVTAADGPDAGGDPILVVCGPRLVAVAHREHDRLQPDVVLEARD